jgi:signal peptidase II
MGIAFRCCHQPGIYQLVRSDDKYRMESCIHQTVLSLRARIILFFILCVICVICDQSSKAAVQRLFADYTVLSLAGGTIRFFLCRNDGALFSTGAGLGPLWHTLFVMWIFSILTAVLFFGLFSRSVNLSAVTASALVFSGGMSNFLDRITHGAVIDFININMPVLRTAVFNVADLIIMAGFCLLSVSLLSHKKGSSITSSLPLPD